MDEPVWINVITTAAPPWKTGTAVNPTIRAAYLAHMGFRVCVVYPWLGPKDQEQLYGRRFVSKKEQESHILEWTRQNVDVEFEFTVYWYDAVYESKIGCVIQKQTTNISCVVPLQRRDIALLEEPEHLNWFHTGKSCWNEYAQVVGIIHTNYAYYAIERDGWIYGNITRVFTRMLCSAYTEFNIHLSAATKARSSDFVCNVHGVRSVFFEQKTPETVSALYFLGKALWSKGYDELARLYTQISGLPRLHSFGTGDDYDAIVERIRAHRLNIVHTHGIDHATDATIQTFRTFVNPSKSEATCTCTAEALAMGKYVVLPVHTSNDFFRNFRNSVFYSSNAEFVDAIMYVQTHLPKPFSQLEMMQLSWQGATRRLFHILQSAPTNCDRINSHFAYMAHRYIVGSQPIHNMLRRVAGVHLLSVSDSEQLNAIVFFTVVLGTVSFARRYARKTGFIEMTNWFV